MLSFDSENLIVDWISFNVEGNSNPQLIAQCLSKHFNPHVIIDNKPSISFHGLKKNYKVCIRHSTGSMFYWTGTQIIFSGKNARHFYTLIKNQKFDWNSLKFDQQKLSLGRIDLCYSRPNSLNHTNKLFDTFLVNCRSKIQNHTTTRHIKLTDFPDGKLLKVNRRNNSIHYRVYQKNENVRFEIEYKNRQTKLVEDFLFQDQFELFENQLVLKYFQYSKRILDLNYVYTDWIVDFQRRHKLIATNRILVTSYLKNKTIENFIEEERLFHLFQFLSFIKSLDIKPFENCEKQKIKNKLYYILKFPLSDFINFTGIKITKQCQREKIIGYFKQLQKLDPIAKEFNDQSFQSYVCFPYVECHNSFGNSWNIEILTAEELLLFSYPFKIPKSFLTSVYKNDLRLKLRLIKALAVPEQKKRLYINELFSLINVPNKQLIKIKKNIIQLLNELVENKVIMDEILLVSKSGKKINLLIHNLTTYYITRRIKYIQFTEIIPT